MNEVLAFSAVVFLVCCFAVFWAEFKIGRKSEAAGLGQIGSGKPGPSGSALKYHPVGPEDMKRYFVSPSTSPADEATKEEEKEGVSFAGARDS
ncbi:MAG: hypothetical protein WA666_01985 [Nitrospirota bacterium]